MRSVMRPVLGAWCAASCVTAAISEFFFVIGEKGKVIGEGRGGEYLEVGQK